MYQDSNYVQEGTYPLTAPPTYGPFTFYAWYYDNTYYYDQTIWVSVYSDIYVYALYY